MDVAEIYTIGDGETVFSKRVEPELPIRAGEILTSVIKGLFDLSGGEVLLEQSKEIPIKIPALQ